MGCVRLLALALLLALTAAAAGPFAGTWKLNKQRSSYGDVPAPVDVTVMITDEDPAIKWSGTVMDAQGETRKFHFQGARDGKEYPVEGTHGKGVMAVNAVGPRELKSRATYAEGKITEETTIAVSADGKSLTRRMTLSRPEGKQSWTEVYDRQ